MSEQKFTPGPWVFGTKGDWTISSAAHSGSLMGNASYYPWVPENKADWHLIAAAPDLYKQLEIAASVFRKYEAHHLAKDDLLKAKSNRELAEQMEAALSKARGEG